MRNRKISKFIRVTIALVFLMTQFLSAGSVLADAPPEVVNADAVYTHYGQSSYWDAALTNVSPNPNAFGITNGTYVGWCVAQTITIGGGTHSVRLYNPSDGTWLEDPQITDPGTKWANIDWKAITWLIDNRGNLTKDEMQDAIWHFSDGKVVTGNAATLIGSMPPTLPETDTYSTQVLVAWNGNDKQLLIIEYTPEKFPVLYDKNNPIATGSQDDPTDPYQPGVDVTVLDEGTMELDDYTFVGWALSSGGAVVYTGSGSEKFRMPGEQVTLYAQWELVPDPDITLTKTADPDSLVDVGDTVTYTLVATNTGNVPLYNVEISDSMLTNLTGNTATVLAVGGTLTATGTYIAEEDDIWAGYIDNFADAEADSTDDQSEPDVFAKAKARVTTITPDPSITLTKVPNKNSGLVEEEIVTYTFTITNTGNVNLYNVLVTDPGVNFVSSSDVIGTLTPSESTTATATYAITEGDIISGSYRNDALVTGYTYQESIITGAAFAVVETEEATSGLQIQKDAVPTSGLEVGDTVDYTLTVTNIGNTTAYYIVVEDTMLTLSPDTTPFDLDNGESKTFTGSYTVQESDLWPGQIDNTASVTGFTEDIGGDGTPDLSDDDSVTVFTVQANPDISIDKTVVGDAEHVYSPGDTISYEMLVTNTGNVTLYYVEVTDEGLDLLSNATQEILAPGASYTATGTYVVKEDDIYAGITYDNTATVEGSYGPWAHDHEEDGWVNDVDSASANLLQPNESVSITKTADVSSVLVGETITYSIYVTNNGNVPIWGTFADPMLDVQQYFELDPGDSTTPVVESYVTTTGDVPQVVNTASVYLNVEGFGDDVDLPTPDDTDTVTVTVGELPPPPPPPPPPTLLPDISVSITPDATLVEAGTPVTFTMVVTNTGQLVLSNVDVVNTDLDFSTVIPTLYVTGSETFTVTKVLDVAGDFTYLVSATGTAPSVSSVSDTDVTAVGVFEDDTPEEPPVIPPEDPTPGDTTENPETGAIPFDALTVSGLLSLGAGVAALFFRKKEKGNEEA